MLSLCWKSGKSKLKSHKKDNISHSLGSQNLKCLIKPRIRKNMEQLERIHIVSDGVQPFGK